MSAVRQFFRRECAAPRLGLQHPAPAAFHVSGWQSARSPVPLLLWRALLLLASAAIAVASFASYVVGPFSAGFWFIYLTHWGLLLMVLSTGFGVAVSLRAYLYGPLSGDFDTPWYAKTFWVFHNAAVPVAFLITVFYWTVLYSADFQEEMNAALDVAVHGANSLVMLLLLLSSAHPCRVLHLVHPLLVALTYAAFGVVYYLAGGTNPLGEPWIYPVVNWAEPGPTVAVVAATGLLLVALHLVAAGIAAARDLLVRRLVRGADGARGAEALALRARPQPAETDA